MTSITLTTVRAKARAIPAVRWLVGAGVIIILGVLALQFLTLKQYELAYIDEGWVANAAWNWLKTGHNFDTMHTGPLDQFGDPSVWRYFIGQSPWLAGFAVFGLGLFQARLVSLLLGIVLLGGLLWVGRRYFSTTSAILAAVLLVVSAPFWRATHTARQDIMLAAVMMLNFGLTWYALENDKWWAHVATGFILIASLDIHQSVMAFFPAHAAIYLLTYQKRFFRARGTWLTALGGLMGAGVFALIHFVPDASIYLKLHGFAIGREAPIPILQPAKLFSSLFGEFQRYNFLARNTDLVMLAASLLYLALRRNKTDRMLLTYIVAAFAGFVLLIGSKKPLYDILLYGFFMLVVAEAFKGLIMDVPAYSRPRIFIAILLVMFVGQGILYFARPVAKTRDYDYYGITDRIEAVLKPDDRILTMPTWWFGLADYDFRSGMSLAYYRSFNGYSLEESLEALRPTVIINEAYMDFLLDIEYEYLMVDSTPNQLIPRVAFDAFLKKRGTIISRFTDPFHGEFIVYRITWENPDCVLRTQFTERHFNLTGAHISSCLEGQST